MPSFASTIPDLQAAGPVVELKLAVGPEVEAAIQAEGQRAGPPIPAVAMIDTGASVSVVREGLPSQLGLHPIGVSNVSTPSSTNIPCYRYLLRLMFPNQVVIEAMVLELPLRGQHIQCLIGRDVLARAVFVYIGHEGLFSLSF